MLNGHNPLDDEADDLETEQTTLQQRQVATRLEAIIVESLNAMPDHFARMTATERGNELVRIRKRLRTELPAIIGAIASDGVPFLVAEVAGFSTSAKGLTFKLLVDEEDRRAHRLMDLRGAKVPIVLTPVSVQAGFDDAERDEAQGDLLLDIPVDDVDRADSAHAVEASERGVAEDETDPDDDRQHATA